ncbi:MAG: dienelactone hydrolase family protein [Gallionella sp.]|nr:dienelactone hydrolase family protein [Gallionella sp.]NCP80090.1 dienelactone hydrolase family protein [Gallionella sp.]NCS75043.1 dienelactone hydrolase family protein [Gallionella sp.]OIO12990.1 MAG: dienelactone hydrolase [Gallionellaceae bacterium CG1_02_60_325]PIV48080.1 MAG: dienelactone hydrolase [Gallionellaceae bacterium CG02_land_8_20_14_3_00_60_115]
MKKLLFSLALLCLTAPALAAVEGEEITYSANGTTLKGWLAYEGHAMGKRPAVLVVHEWWGHNAYARKRANMLAKLGYVALAVDMYGDGKQAQHPDDAGKFATEVSQNKPMAKARFEAAMKVLRDDPRVDGGKLAAIGYCFGGSVVLNMARAGEDLKGVASFHGGLATDAPAHKGAVKAQVRSFTGADDKMIPAAQVAAFEQEMKNAGVNYRTVVYPGTLHSFTNPDADEYGRKFNLPLAYNARADKDSWLQLQDFLAEVLQ